MRCLYCGETLAKPPEDAAQAFCSIGHRQMYQWNRASTGNGAAGSRSVAQLVVAAEAGEEGETAWAAFQKRRCVPAEGSFGVRAMVAESEPFPYPATLPESAPAADPGLYETWLEPWPAVAVFGPRKPRQPRMPLFATFPIGRRLPGRSVRPGSGIPLCSRVDMVRLLEGGKRLARSKMERPLVFPAKAILGRLRSSLTVADMEPLPPIVENLREKAAAAARLAPGADDPPSSQLMAIAPHDPAARASKPRQTRFRDHIQWAAKMVDLDGLGRLLAAQEESPRFVGIDSWHPGPVRAWVEPRLSAPAGAALHRGISHPVDLKLDPLAGSALPHSRLTGHAAALTSLAARLDVELICPPVACLETSFRLLDAELESAAPETAPSVPESRLAETRPSLGATFLIRHTSMPMIEPGLELRGLDTSLLETGVELDPLAPVYAGRPPAARQTFLAAEEQLPVTVSPRAAETSIVYTGTLEFLRTEATPPQPAAPAFSWVRRFVPPLVQAQSKLHLHSALAFTGPSFTPGEMAPIHSEANRVVPKLKLKLVEDRAVAEAVQLYKETSSRGLLQTLLARFRPAKASAAPASSPGRKGAKSPKGDAKPSPLLNLKWAFAGLPVVLAVGFFVYRNGKEQTAEALPEGATTVAEAPQRPAGATAAPARRAESKAPEKAKVETARQDTPAPPSSAEPAGFLANVKQAILKRAAVSLSDDFRGGLGDWQGYGEWSKQWSYDAATFLNTGPSVVLYTPSLPLSNYRVDFLGQIERKSLGWVFRAKDGSNYHAAKITLTRGGPLPRAIVEHYTVINGREDRHQSRPLPLEIRADTLYRVGMDVQDSDFTLSVQGQIVDHWSDNRLASGGIGFFSARGEQSRLRWVEVSHQYDTLGKLCAFLAPYSMPAREGNQK